MELADVCREGVTMTEHQDDLREPRFDGVLGARSNIGLPLVRTLSDDYRDRAEPVESDRVPPPAPSGMIGRRSMWIRGLACARADR